MLEEPGTGGARAGGARHWQVTSCVQGASFLPADGRAPGSHGHSWPSPGQVSLKASQTKTINIWFLICTLVLYSLHVC